MAATKWAAMFLTPMLLAACAVPAAPHSGIGLGLQRGSSRVGISYLRCTAEEVTSVELTTAPPNGSGKTIWRISRGPAARDTTQFVLGASPPGWLVSVPMRQLPSKTEGLILSVETTKRSPGGISFSIGDLKPGMILSDNGSVSHSTYITYKDYC